LFGYHTLGVFRLVDAFDDESHETRVFRPLTVVRNDDRVAVALRLRVLGRRQLETASLDLEPSTETRLLLVTSPLEPSVGLEYVLAPA
jgi:hypothetical protein